MSRRRRNARKGVCGYKKHEGVKIMKIVDEYYFKNETRKIALYEYETEKEMEESGLLESKNRQTCFMSDGKYYIGVYKED